MLTKVSITKQEMFQLCENLVPENNFFDNKH